MWELQGEGVGQQRCAQVHRGVSKGRGGGLELFNGPSFNVCGQCFFWPKHESKFLGNSKVFVHVVLFKINYTFKNILSVFISYFLSYFLLYIYRPATYFNKIPTPRVVFGVKPPHREGALLFSCSS